MYIYNTLFKPLPSAIPARRSGTGWVRIDDAWRPYRHSRVKAEPKEAEAKEAEPKEASTPSAPRAADAASSGVAVTAAQRSRMEKNRAAALNLLASKTK